MVHAIPAGPSRVRPLSIGPLVIDPPVLQAPMAGFTNYAYRQIVRQFGGVGLQATEMVMPRAFCTSSSEEHEFPDRLWGVKDEPRPLAVQIWDNDPASAGGGGGAGWPTNSASAWSTSTSAAR